MEDNLIKTTNAKVLVKSRLNDLAFCFRLVWYNKGRSLYQINKQGFSPRNIRSKNSTKSNRNGTYDAIMITRKKVSALDKF